MITQNPIEPQSYLSFLKKRSFSIFIGSLLQLVFLLGALHRGLMIQVLILLTMSAGHILIAWGFWAAHFDYFSDWIQKRSAEGAVPTDHEKFKQWVVSFCGVAMFWFSVLLLLILGGLAASLFALAGPVAFALNA